MGGALLRATVVLAIAFVSNADEALAEPVDAMMQPAPYVNNDPVHPTGSKDIVPPMSASAAAADAGNAARAVAAAVPTSYDLAGTQEAQQTSYWCGPATIRESLRQISPYHAGTTILTQSQAATQLGTDTNGTAWSNGSGYPMANVMNRNTPAGVHYYAHAVGSPTATEINNFGSNLRADAGENQIPVIGDAWETASSKYHLVGHPTDRTIFHWFNVRGYASSGATAHYEDSVHNAVSVSWYSGVPAYSSLSATAITTIVAGRGYIY